MGFKLGTKSKEKLKDVHPKLAKIVARAIELSEVDFTVVQGNRTQAQQDALYAQGRTKPGPIVTKTRNSNHIGGRAVDIMPWIDGKLFMPDRPTKEDAKLWFRINQAMQLAACEDGIKLRWGGDFNQDGNLTNDSFVDLPHWELPKTVK